MLPPQRAGSWIVREVEEAEEWVVEGASHGLADATCFELYGFPSQAPALSDSPNSKAQVTRSPAFCLANLGITCDSLTSCGPSVFRALCKPTRRAGFGSPEWQSSRWVDQYQCQYRPWTLLWQLVTRMCDHAPMHEGQMSCV